MGVVAMIVAGILESIFIKHDITNPDLFFSTRTLFIDFMLVGIIEEAVKFLPLLVWLWRKPYFTERTDGVIYFALGGLGFGFAENILYTLADGAGTGIGRLIIVSFFHAALTGLRAILWPAPRPRDYQSGLRYCHWPWLWCCTACMILGWPASITHVCPGRAVHKFVHDHWHVYAVWPRRSRRRACAGFAPPVGGSCLRPMQFDQNCVAKGPGPMALTGV